MTQLWVQPGGCWPRCFLGAAVSCSSRAQALGHGPSGVPALSLWDRGGGVPCTQGKVWEVESREPLRLRGRVHQQWAQHMGAEETPHAAAGQVRTGTYLHPPTNWAVLGRVELSVEGQNFPMESTLRKDLCLRPGLPEPSAAPAMEMDYYTVTFSLAEGNLGVDF